jgi:tRNA/rRNA methyltransferase
MRVKVIILEPKYQMNLGYIARTAMNFGVEKLFIVNPRAKVDGNKAIMYSKHAHSLLENARIYRTLDEATRGCGLIVGTTGIRDKAKSNFRRVYFAEDAVRRMKKMRSGGTAALIIGRDDIGLRREEVEKCDMLAYISTNPEYPVLNVSHSLAIFLYLLNREKIRTMYSDAKSKEEAVSEGELKTLLALFGKMIEKKKLRDRRAVMGIFKRIMRDTQPSRQELHALISAMK